MDADRPPEDVEIDDAAIPAVVDRSVFQAEIDALRIREKAHTRAGDALAAARRRLPMVEVDATTKLTGPDGLITLLEAFGGRRQLIVYYFMWHAGQPAGEQCEGCTFFTTQLRDLSFLNVRGITFAVFCQGPFDESDQYRDLMGWEMPWYSIPRESSVGLLAERQPGMFYLVCYLRDRDRVFETYWTNGRGVEAMDNTYGLMDLTVYGRQQTWESSPAGWPRKQFNREVFRIGGRPIPQWARLHIDAQ